VSPDQRLVTLSPAYDVNLALESDDGSRAALARKRRQYPPAVRDRIVFEESIVGLAVGALRKATRRVDTPVQGIGAHVVQSARHRGTGAPAVGRRIIFVVAVHVVGNAARRTTQEIDPAADHGGRELGSPDRDRRSNSPGPLPIGHLGQRARCNHQGGSHDAERNDVARFR